MSIDAMKQALVALQDARRYGAGDWSNLEDTLRFAIEQAEKQEPVAWMKNESFVDADNLWDVRVTFNQDGDGIPLYTAPPQRQPLTDEEIKTLCVANGWDSSWQSMRFARAIERKHGIGDEHE